MDRSLGMLCGRTRSRRTACIVLAYLEFRSRLSPCWALENRLGRWTVSAIHFSPSEALIKSIESKSIPIHSRLVLHFFKNVLQWAIVTVHLLPCYHAPLNLLFVRCELRAASCALLLPQLTFLPANAASSVSVPGIAN